MSLNLYNILAVGIGGFFGAISRFYFTIIVSNRYHCDIPLATLGVNVFGSFVLGVFFAIFTLFNPSETIKAFVTIGFLGAFTTYSTFALESFLLLGNSLWYGVLNIVLNLTGSIVAVVIGYKIVIFLTK